MLLALNMIIEPGEDGGFVSSIPEIPGVFSQGATPEEAEENCLSALKEMCEFRYEKARKELKATHGKGFCFECRRVHFSWSTERYASDTAG